MEVEQPLMSAEQRGRWGGCCTQWCNVVYCGGYTLQHPLQPLTPSAESGANTNQFSEVPLNVRAMAGSQTDQNVKHLLNHIFKWELKNEHFLSGCAVIRNHFVKMHITPSRRGEGDEEQRVREQGRARMHPNRKTKVREPFYRRQANADK